MLAVCIPDANAADKAGGIGISASIGASSSQSQQQSSADSAKGSNLNAGGNIRIAATGDGANSDITVRGSDVKAAGATALKADDQINLLAAQNTTQESSTSKNSSGSIGVGINLGSDGFKAGVTVITLCFPTLNWTQPNCQVTSTTFLRLVGLLTNGLLACKQKAMSA